MDKDELSERIKTTTQATTDLVNSLGSFKHIAHTVFLIGSLTTLGLLGWAGYKYVDTYVRTPVNIDELELLAKSASGMCSFYRRGHNTYIVEYFKGFDKLIDANIHVVAKFTEYPRNVGKTCSLLKDSKSSVPMQTAEPEVIKDYSIETIN